MTELILAPSPEVQHLPTIFRRIQAGDIRIPAFQRGFIWLENQVLDLLESIYNGYPIGSLLFWRVNKEILHIGYSDKLPFPDVKPQYPLSYVLDGMQRLSTLYGVFNENENKFDEFKVAFDFNKKEFINIASQEAPPTSLKLDSLFVPKQLLAFHASVLKEQNSDTIINETLKLQSIFQEYLIPTVTITRDKIPEVVEIFRRINSTGTKLGTVDFMRALTWSGRFDLNVELEEFDSSIEHTGFQVDPETTVKLLSIVMGHAPISSDMMKLKEKSSDELKDGIAKAVDTVQKSIHFFNNELNIYNIDMIPYEGLLLGIAKVYSINKNPSGDVLATLNAWYWSISINEALRGKPDHYVARALNILERVALGDANAHLDCNLKITPEIYTERRFIKGKALSLSFVTMFAKNNARSLITGEIIPPSEYMHSEAGDAFTTILSLTSLRELRQYRRHSSARIFTNLFLTTPDDRKAISDSSFDDVINNIFTKFDSQKSSEILESQFIDSDFIEAELSTNDYESIFRARSLNLFSFAKRLTEL